MSTQLTNLLALSSLTDPVPEQPSSANRSLWLEPEKILSDMIRTQKMKRNKQ
jgi:hypothetical protein